MKGKDVVRIILGILLILYTTLYVTQATGYYEFSNSRTTTLTENAIAKYEQDLKEGKEIDVKDYIEEEKNYNNNFSKLSMGVSNIIEKGFDKIMNYFFNEIDKMVKPD